MMCRKKLMPSLGADRWAKKCKGRHLQRHHHGPRRTALSLRPVNVKGLRCRGMRAPKNTNQFLMQEKYQLQHLRSDSVGSDTCGGSDSETELTDMDSYLNVLENARGALSDGTEPQSSPTLPRRVLVLQEEGLPAGLQAVLKDGLQWDKVQEDALQKDSIREVTLQEDSLPYFSSDDDVLKSHHFMQRDFLEFCHILMP